MIDPCRLTLHETPPGETHWSCRTMAQRTGVSSSTVQRIWSARGLKPHRMETLSNDPAFEEKLVDVVGLYLNSGCLAAARACPLSAKLV